jgi:hypothetical protein
MQQNRTLAWIALVFIAAAVAAGTVSSGASTVPGAARLAGAAGGLPPDLAGTWQGQWVDTVFTVTGPAEWTLEVNGSSVTLMGTNDLTGVGLGAAEPFELTGTIVGDSLGYTFMFSGGSALTSTGEGAIVGSGPDNMAGTGNVGAPLFFGDYAYTATITSTTMNGTFTYTGGGAGRLEMTKSVAVEKDTWGRTKGRYRSGG